MTISLWFYCSAGGTGGHLRSPPPGTQLSKGIFPGNSNRRPCLHVFAAMPPRPAPPPAQPCAFMGRPAQTGMCAGSPAASRRVLPFGILLDVPIDTARGACTIQVGSYFTSETEVA